MDKKRGQVIAQKKGNKDLRRWLRVIYVVVLLLLIYSMTRVCPSSFNWNFDILAVIILVAIALVLKSVPLALLVIAVFGILFYIAPFCPAHV